jgi:Zn-dependent protease
MPRRVRRCTFQRLDVLEPHEIGRVTVSHGWWTLGRIRGAPIRVHWTLLVGALVWSRFRFEPAFWLGFVLLILIHELGHAAIVVRYRLGLSEIALHGAGGYCRHERSGSRFEEAFVAWGGVLAQLALYAVVQVATLAFGQPSSRQLWLLHYVFTDINLWIAALNLIPFEPLDGARAWPLLGMLVARFRKQARIHEAASRRRSVEDELRELERLDTRTETPSQRTDRLVRELIARTTNPKDR